MYKVWCKNKSDLNNLKKRLEDMPDVNLNLPVGIYITDYNGDYYYCGFDREEAYSKHSGTELSVHDMCSLASKPNDSVNHPSHYASGKIECIDAMIQYLGKEIVADFCLANTWKYLWRHRDKNGEEDIKKATWYFDKFKEIIEG